MKNFKDFGIIASDKNFIGEKIRISKILNREIIVDAFTIKDSKIFKDRGSGKCLCLQIRVDEKKHILFTGSNGLIEEINQVKKDNFPFITTIKEENEKYLFT